MDDIITATEIQRRFDYFNYEMECHVDKFLEPLVNLTYKIIEEHKNG